MGPELERAAGPAAFCASDGRWGREWAGPPPRASGGTSGRGRPLQLLDVDARPEALELEALLAIAVVDAELHDADVRAIRREDRARAAPARVRLRRLQATDEAACRDADLAIDGRDAHATRRARPVRPVRERRLEQVAARH